MLFQPPVFETIFRIPAAHRLMIMGSRSRGGPADGVCWFHTEHDAAGQPIARYETYDETDVTGQDRCGWRKYDARGRLVACHEVAMRWSQLVRMASRREAEIALQGPAPSRTAPTRRGPRHLAA
ncbi:hypothetical protein [Methylobacterium nodulans]|uniref:Uncharacterized protein n=1 Tax=Methylobacterium nodulans (strain LMG 21967 / CNCM I-2342 / ORS 2060) TaxID=460265 RepID=B8IEW5_METNO|nr:hypothetical protein [Methylobacterium nodulans]ACL61458.1 conserved hypothetical protein [Methylobacterium nodulans ORS 2060]